MRRLGLFAVLAASAFAQPPVAPGARSEMDAHNCYPYDGRWADRINRALSAGTPLAIEQDLAWYTDPSTGRSRSVVTHGGKGVTGADPSMRDYFFERIRPLMEQALRRGNHGDWPLITLNLDFKSDEPAHHAAVWKLLGEYESWLSTAARLADPNQIAPMRAGPLLVLTGNADSQEHDFHDVVPAGSRLRLFGAVNTARHVNASMPPEAIVLGRATNYRRWWNNPWGVVEAGGQRKAGAWTEASEARLRTLVAYAHSHGLYIRFYTLDGASPETMKANGWFLEYDVGTLEAAETRWLAAEREGVDYIASDEYETLGRFLRDHPPAGGATRSLEKNSGGRGAESPAHSQ